MTIHSMLIAVAQTRGWDGHMMWGWGWMWLFGLLFVLLVVGGVIAAVWLGVRGGARPQQDPTVRAREILNERYARGEIATEEYRERLDALR
jgi:putative membrane protein